MPDLVFGCDGATYTFTFYRGMNQVVYTWWCEASVGYKPLIGFANELLKEAGVKNMLEHDEDADYR